ncbi:Asp/Glu racemase [Thermococcus litoralis DSM 5473]|uniref:Asp/Glu racemase n=1 Tax=Thermococcus litoralis (strain ATCC 51850 / DSM 5473 / JCM 8560 / NS-C) TaxID=523849 RepID=H3ZQG3_THELN|nr:aspartate/glutamate racemase family protein [Thermococcus litoralis]EHR78162.1 Asp/Glu racemase [Thermococcus litoralis DSM 5473]
MILIVDPIKGGLDKATKEYISKYFPNDEFSVLSLKEGPKTIESFTDKTLACSRLLENLDMLKNANAIVINCFADPCLFELRENLNVPIFGVGETTMHIAAMLGEFSVIGPGDNMISWTRIQAREYGIFDKLVSVHKIKFSVDDILEADERLYKATKDACLEAIDKGADVIVLGCTGFMTIAKRLREEIWEEFQIPVLEPLLVTYSVARSLSLVFRHGKRGLFSGRVEDESIE